MKSWREGGIGEEILSLGQGKPAHPKPSSTSRFGSIPVWRAVGSGSADLQPQQPEEQRKTAFTKAVHTLPSGLQMLLISARAHCRGGCFRAAHLQLNAVSVSLENKLTDHCNPMHTLTYRCSSAPVCQGRATPFNAWRHGHAGPCNERTHTAKVN